MRVAWKLTLALTVAIFAALGLHMLWSADHTVQRLAERHADDLEVRADLFAQTIATVWRVDGPYKAEWLADRTARSMKHHELAWMPADPDPPPSFFGTEAQWETLRGGRALGTRETPAGERLVTYAPVVVEDRTRAILALVEPVALQRAELRDVVFDRGSVAALLLVICGLVVIFASFRLVGGPLQELTSHVRRIAEGDLSGRVRIRSRDELGRLAEEVNHMTERLIDAQERIRAESEQRVAALTQLRHAGRLKLVGQLTAGVAHELGTPLNVIGGRAKLVARGLVEGEDAAECGRIIAQQAERMSERIHSLLGFARRESIRHERLDLRRILHESRELLEPMLHKARAEVILDADEEPVCIEGDPSHLEQVFANLLTNAMQAMPDGGEIRIHLDHPAPCPEALPPRAGPCVHMTVSDTGAGIPDEVRERIFEPFFTTKGDAEGTGLGLAVSLGIVREHGGWMEVESTPGRGTTFHLWFPLVPPDSADDG